MIPEQIVNLRDRGALFVANHSAGKDSQAMTILLRSFVPASQLVTVHADLGEIEWPGNVEHIQRYPHGRELIVARPVRDMLTIVEARGMWPDKKRRWCTSDLKRGPISREIRRYLAANPQFGGLVVDCQGMRADESPDRKKLEPLFLHPYEMPSGRPTGTSLRPRGRQPGREWWSWLPIHGLSAADVFTMIRAAGEEPHPVYGQGMSRLSCSFCIMASQADLCTAAILRPDLYARYVKLEKKVGHTFSMSRKPLEEVTGIAA